MVKTKTLTQNEFCNYINLVVDIYQHKSDNNYFINNAFLIRKYIYSCSKNKIYQNIYKKIIWSVRVSKYLNYNQIIIIYITLYIDSIILLYIQCIITSSVITYLLIIHILKKSIKIANVNIVNILRDLHLVISLLYVETSY